MPVMHRAGRQAGNLGYAASSEQHLVVKPNNNIIARKLFTARSIYSTVPINHYNIPCTQLNDVKQLPSHHRISYPQYYIGHSSFILLILYAVTRNITNVTVENNNFTF